MIKELLKLICKPKWWLDGLCFVMFIIGLWAFFVLLWAVFGG